MSEPMEDKRLERGSWCWPWTHRLGKWSEPIVATLTYTWGGEGQAYYQRRACSVCNKVELRRVV